MTRTVGLIHAVIPAMQPVREAFASELPAVRLLNLLDEALLKEAERLGTITPGLVRRMTGLVALLEAAEAELVLFTCTAYSPFVEAVRAQSGIPVLPIDEPMLRAALGVGRRIGVLATIAAGLEQQRRSLERVAGEAGQEITIDPVLRPDAFVAISGGDPARHDQILLEELDGLARRVDVVVLAQASMAGLMCTIPANLSVPVLSSPRLAVASVKEMLQL